MSVLLVLGVLATQPTAPPWWNAPPECPTEADVAKLIEQEAAVLPPEQRDAIDLRATVVATANGTWKLEVDVRRADASVHRSLELDSCEAASEATALVYAVALTTITTAGTSSEDEPVPEPEPAPERAPVPVPPPAVDDTNASVEPVASPPVRPNPPEDDAASSPMGGLVYVLGGLGVGGIGPVGGALELGAGLTWPRLRVGLAATHGIVRRVRVGDVGGNLSSTAGGVRLAVPTRPAGNRFEVVPAVHALAGGIRGRGVGGETAFTRWVPWVVLGAGLDAAWRATPHVGLRLGARLDVPLLRHRFVFDELAVSTTRRVGGRILAGIEIRFPE